MLRSPNQLAFDSPKMNFDLVLRKRVKTKQFSIPEIAIAGG